MKKEIHFRNASGQPHCIQIFKSVVFQLALLFASIFISSFTPVRGQDLSGTWYFNDTNNKFHITQTASTVTLYSEAKRNEIFIGDRVQDSLKLRFRLGNFPPGIPNTVTLRGKYTMEEDETERIDMVLIIPTYDATNRREGTPDRVTFQLKRTKKRIINYTAGRRQLEAYTMIETLLGGENIITETKAGRRHDSKGVLIITDASTDDVLLIRASQFEPPAGEYKIWLHHSANTWSLRSALPVSAQAFFDIRDGNGNKAYTLTGMIQYLQTPEQGAPINISGSGEDQWSLDDVATGFYELFDWVADGIAHARIPEYVWNCDKPGYEPTYAKVYKYSLFIFNPMMGMLTGGLSELANRTNVSQTIKDCLENIAEGRVFFSFGCGLWNGVIELGKSIPEMGKLIIGPFSSKGRADFTGFMDKLSRFKKEDPSDPTGQKIECEGTWCAIKTGLGAQFDPTKCCQFSEVIGEFTLPLLLSFIAPEALVGVVEGTAGKVIFQIIKVMQWIDKLGDPFQYIQASFRFISSTASVIRTQTGRILVRIENDIVHGIVLLQDGFAAIRHNADEVVFATTGPAIRATFPKSAGASGITGKVISVQLYEILQARGVRTRTLAQVANLVDDLGGFLNRLEKAGLSHENLNRFLDDLASSPELLNHFKNLDVVTHAPEKLADAWVVLSRDAALRKNPADLDKIARFIRETSMDKSRLTESFANARDARLWIDMKISQAELEGIYNGFKNSPPGSLTPWTPQHKAQRWEQYKARCIEDGGEAPNFNNWSNTYDGNIVKAASASRAVDDFFSTLGWNCQNCREVSINDITIQTPEGTQAFTRRMDIADVNARKGIEFKEYSSGKVYRSPDIMREVALDAKLIELGTFAQIEWVFKNCEPSSFLRRDLQAAGIKIRILPP
jgi:hypothetical protein